METTLLSLILDIALALGAKFFQNLDPPAYG